MRALLYFPIIHSPEDLGSLNKTASDLRTEEQEKKYLDAIEHFWGMVETTIESLDLDYGKLKLYQDGLPICGKEKEIVTDVAKAGSKNYQLLELLESKGAIVMGTESPELLVKERDLIIQLLKPDKPTPSILIAAKNILDSRDSFIAKRIDKTLQDDEMAILFIGLSHEIDTKLPKDIVVIHPLGKPKEKKPLIDD